MPTTATNLAEEAEAAFDQLEETLNEKKDLREPVENKHPEIALDPGTRIMKCPDLPMVPRRVEVELELKEWIRKLADRQDGSMSSVARRILLWQTNRVLTQDKTRPEHLHQPTGEQAHLTFTIEPTVYKLVQMAAKQWNTTATAYTADALHRYRQRVEEEV